MANHNGPGGWIAAACTLPTVNQPLRMAQFDEFFRTAVRRWTRPQATALELVIPAQIETSARDLAQREASCCSFFTFDFEPTDDAVVMRIGVPELHVDVLDALQARVATLVGTGST